MSINLFMYFALGATTLLLVAQYAWSVGFFEKKTIKVALDDACPDDFASAPADQEIAAQRRESGRATGRWTEQAGTTPDGAVMILETRKPCREL
ncbi:hypothetical protein [Flavimaricola marinus]|uniref:Uncharacterized protein n=1 Tax=Flavimaricola marinus TaxID=1819565 RepID=A0A238LDP0_9RHOB|nr:hypothetical protein [Flavimaricola marinus]SMY07799.1 hypothetical protein LOM8899_01939 [Flavimaricola marinus]